MRYLYRAEFSEIKREAFNEVADKIKADNDLWLCTNVKYDGNGRAGILTIEAYPGREKEFKKSLQIFMDIYAK